MINESSLQEERKSWTNIFLPLFWIHATGALHFFSETQPDLEECFCGELMLVWKDSVPDSFIWTKAAALHLGIHKQTELYNVC